MRGMVYGVGAGLIAWGVFFSLVTTLFWIAILIGALILIAAGLTEYLAKLDDCGYDDTPQGQEAIEQADDFREWSCEMAEFDVRAVWPNEAGAPE